MGFYPRVCLALMLAASASLLFSMSAMRKENQYEIYGRFIQK
jgi:hypothetical protein